MASALEDLGEEVSGRLVAARHDTLIPVFSLALSASDRAHAPYSKFHVGAIITSSAGRTFAGCNVENASYPIGTCAERDAIAAFVLGREQGERLATLALVAVDWTSKAPVLAPSSPCGGCRQSIMQFGGDSEVQFFWGDPLALTTARASELLPFAFALTGARGTE